MHMKFKIMLISSVILTIVVISMITINNMDKKEKNIIKSKEEEKEIIKGNMLTLMYETEAGSKEYEESKDNTWPEEGYIFNKNLSGCENGGELEYNSQNNTVNLLTNKSDKCYVYFDKYDGVWINNVIATNITGSSITIDISATSENGSISKYYYQVNESGYIESTSNIITIEDLNKLTEYKIEVYAVDSTNAKSNIYELNVSTTEQEEPKINFILVEDITYNLISLSIETESENDITTYYYSKDGGNNYIESSNNKYTFTNLNSDTEYSLKVYVKDVNKNISKEYNVTIKTKYLNPIINSITITDTTTSSINISISASGGTNNVATYYYSINNGAYTSSTSNTKTFTGLSAGTTYTIKVYVKDTNGVDSAVKTSSAETENIVLLADYIKGLYTSQGSNGLYYHTSSLANSAADNSYRYAGANPNNYVCFGSTSSTCPSDNLYRIIGVFGSEVKLIKATSYGSYAWDSGGSNTWSTSSIRTMLNSTYLSSLSSTWQSKISTHTWKVGGMERNTSYTAKQYYYVEVGSSYWTTDSMKIGLMYVSDYGFAASNSYWTTNIVNYDSAKNNNWMHMGLYEWTISRDSSYSNGAFAVVLTGDISSFYVFVAIENLPVRPSFYLTSSTTYVSGSGTSSDPIRIN